MNKLFVSFVTLLTILSVPTAQVRANELAMGAAISELQYRLSVEWDQQDQTTKSEIFKSFAQKVNQLRKAGLSDDQLLESVAVETGNPQSIKDLKALAAYAKENHLSLSQIDGLVTQYASHTNQTGAHWTGKGHEHKKNSGSFVVVGIAVIAVIVVVAVIVRSRSVTNNTTNNNTTNNTTNTTTTTTTTTHTNNGHGGGNGDNGQGGNGGHSNGNGDCGQGGNGQGGNGGHGQGGNGGNGQGGNGGYGQGGNGGNGQGGNGDNGQGGNGGHSQGGNDGNGQGGNGGYGQGGSYGGGN